MAQKVSPPTDEIVLESEVDNSRRGANDPFAGFKFDGPGMSRQRVEAPAAPPVEPKDPDKALTNIALGILRFNGWPCQEGSDYRSFVMDVQFRTPKRGVIATDRFCVWADQGVLYFEQPVLDLPTLPEDTPLLEALNQINLHSVGSMFTFIDNCVSMRHVMIPRSKTEGYMTSAMIVQTIRQMFYDRRCALSLLRQVVETRQLDPLCVAKTYQRAVAPAPIASLTLSQAENLANFAGYHTQNDGKQIFLSRSIMPRQMCPVRLIPCSGFLRGETTIGEVRTGMSARLKELIKGRKSQVVYEHLNNMNLDPNPLRYVSSMKSVIAMSTFFPTDKDMTVEQFRIFAETLLEPEQ
jgi:hypothetical protein